MLVYHRDTNHLLNVACYSVISEHERITGEPPTGLFFNKVLSIINKEFAPSVQIGLPHCWYRWGDEVVRILMPTPVQWFHEDPPRTTVGWDADPPEVPAAVDAYERVIGRVRSLVETYSSPGRVENLVSHVYSYAPFPFQDAYRRLRNIFIDLRGAEIPIDGLSSAVITPPLENAMEVFPFHDFPSMQERAETFHILMNGLLAADVKGLELARELSESFWLAFCYHLRLHPEAHENIPEDTLEYWRNNLEIQLAHYDNSFNGIVLDAADISAEILEVPGVGNLVNEAEHKRSEDLKLISSFDAELDDIGKFLEAVRQLRE